jgi:hypothetical protein
MFTMRIKVCALYLMALFFLIDFISFVYIIHILINKNSFEVKLFYFGSKCFAFKRRKLYIDMTFIFYEY